MPNFWDNISQNNINNYNKQQPNLMQFIAQNRGKTLDQMLREYNLTNITEDDIKRTIPQAQQLLRQLGIKL